MGDWEYLLPSMLELILERLPLTDYLRFAAVCSSWRDVQKAHRLHHTASPRYHLQMPWLIIPKTTRNHSQILLYNQSERKYYRPALPTLEGKHHIGSSLGWLLLVDLTWDTNVRGYFDRFLIIANPLTRLQFEIPIPPWSIVPSLPMGVLSSVPTDSNCFVLLHDMSGFTDRLLLCHVKNKTCNILLHPNKGLFFGCPTFCKGKFFSLSYKMEIVMVDPLPVPVVRCIQMDIGLGLSLPKPSWRYLLECDGELLLVREELSQKKKYLVFKANFSEKLWERVDTLGDRILFLDMLSHSFSFLATHVQVPGNCIFSTALQPTGNIWKLSKYDYGIHRTTSFNLPHLLEDDMENFDTTRSSWIMPSLL